MLYVVPIEPLEERYSAQWLEWTRTKLPQLNTDVRIINAPSYQKITHGAFLDVVGTNLYKNAQMETILRLINAGTVKDGDVFWFHDMWFPGLEMLAYIRDGLGLKIKIYGCLHAGTYDQHDFTHKKGMTSWGRPLEDAWFTLVDGIFVATNFHREMVSSRRSIVHSKMHVTGFPIYPDFAPKWDKSPKEKIVVFPHRLDAEKQPELFFELTNIMSQTSWGCDYQFVLTKRSCKTKEDYYDTLRHAKYAVSFALQETWGIAMQEAVLGGCIPIVPDRLSYFEMYPDVFRYRGGVIEAAALMQHIEHADQFLIREELKELQRKFIQQGTSAFENMLVIMGLV